MFDSSIKTQKINHPSAIKTAATYKASLSHLPNQLQTLSIQIAEVIDIADDGDAIFTTHSSNKIKVLNSVNAKVGDKIKVERTLDDKYALVSIVERNNENSANNDIIAVTSYRKNLAHAAVIKSSALQEGEIIYGTFISLDNDLEIIKEELTSVIQIPYSLDKYYRFKVLAIENKEHKALKQLVVAQGLVSTLHEILSDDSENENSFVASVLGFDEKEVILKTLFGTLIIDKKFSVAPGTKLILKLVQEDHSIETNAESLKVNNIIKDLLFLQKILLHKKNSSKNFLVNPLLGLVAHSLTKVDIDKEKHDNKIKDIMNTLSFKLLEGKNTRQLIDVLSEIDEGLQSINEGNFDNIKGNWLVTALPLYFEKEFYKPRLLIKRLNKEIIRIISNISLSSFGEMQLDCLIKIKNKKKKERVIEKVDLVIRHKKLQRSELVARIKEDFTKSLSLFSINSNVIFEQTEEFYTDQELERENQAFLSSANRMQSLIV